MNEKQNKLLRYFVRHTGDVQLALSIFNSWPSLDHKAKAKISGWLKRVVVTMMHVKDQRLRYEEGRRAAQNLRNMEILKEFTSVLRS